MQSSFKYITFGVIIIALFGCNDEIMYNQTAHENQIVVHARAEVGKNLKVTLRESERITEDTLDSPIGGVAIELYVNSAPKEATYSDAVGQAFFNYNVKTGDSLRITMVKQSFTNVETEAVVPSDVGILQFDTTNNRPSVQGLRLSFYDKPNETNFYQLSLKGSRWYYFLNPNTGERMDSVLSFEDIDMRSVNRLFFSDNNIVNNRQNFELLNDQIFNGKNFVLDVDVGTFQLAEQSDRSAVQMLQIELKNISADYYNFLATLSLNRPVYGGPFSISSQVPSNIYGGYGIFAAYSADKATITLK